MYPQRNFLLKAGVYPHEKTLPVVTDRQGFCRLRGCGTDDGSQYAGDR
jgi:hypothetical protein